MAFFKKRNLYCNLNLFFSAQFATCVDSDLVDTVLGHILSIASTQFYCRKSEWIVKLTSEGYLF